MSYYFVKLLILRSRMNFHSYMMCRILKTIQQNTVSSKAVVLLLSDGLSLRRKPQSSVTNAYTNLGGKIIQCYPALKLCLWVWLPETTPQNNKSVLKTVVITVTLQKESSGFEPARLISVSMYLYFKTDMKNVNLSFYTAEENDHTGSCLSLKLQNSPLLHPFLCFPVCLYVISCAGLADSASSNGNYYIER